MSSNTGGRRKDPNWKHVTKIDDRWRCNYCGELYSGGVTRIKVHLNIENGTGISRCSKYGVHNNMASGSGNPQEPGEARCDAAQGEQGQALTSGLEPQDHMSGFVNHHQDNAETVFFSLPNETIIDIDEFWNQLPPVIGEASFGPASAGIQGPALTSVQESQDQRSDLVNHQNSAEPEIPHLSNEARLDPAQGIQRQDLTSEQESQDQMSVDGSILLKDTFEPEITLLNELVSGLESGKGDIERYIHWLLGEGKKRKRHVFDWLDGIEDLRRRANDMKNFKHPMSSNIFRQEIKQLIGEIRCHKEDMPFVLSTEIVGKSFEMNTRKMWKLLGDDQVSIIGIHGMGGVGKTLLAYHVLNEIKRKRAFKDVFWVTVSQNFSISELQDDIAKRIGLKLDENDEILRASNLCLALKEKENSVLFLDNIWNYIDFEKVGIPSRFKVILTTRLKHLCEQMDCLPDNMINMLPLETYEAEELFKLKLGYDGIPATLSPEVEEIVRCFVMNGCCLPRRIIVIARTMKGINIPYRWRHLKDKLEMGEEVEEEVCKELKTSYDNLKEKSLQDCFLYTALLPCLERGELIMKLVDNKLINGKRSLEKIFDEGNTILDKLESHSLLWKGGATMNLASHILKESQRHVMVNFGSELRGEWTKDLELVNLMGSNMEKMTEGTSPFCPQLSTLILSRHLSRVPPCFFQNMNGLRILHISEDNEQESLPNSLPRSLVSLELKQCCSLKYVPPLGELQALSRLVISECSIDKVPEGLEKLNLKWLDLSHNEILRGFADVLCKLISLQYLDLRCCPHVKIKVEDVQEMKMLECFGGTFFDHKHYKHYVLNILDKHLGPETYELFVANGDAYLYNSCKCILLDDLRTKTVHLPCDEDFSQSPILPEDLTDLYIDCLGRYSFRIILSGQATFSSLRKINIVNCELKNVFSSSCVYTTIVQNLQGLYLRKMGSLTAICEEEVLDVGRTFSMGATFSCLKDLELFRCSIKKLLTPRLILQLPNLERISVRYCKSIEQIFADNGYSNEDSFSIILPKLTTLVLYQLPRLKTVSNISLLLPGLESVDIKYCNSIEEIFVVDGSFKVELPKLTNLALSWLPQLKTLCKEIVSFGPVVKYIIEECPNFDWIFTEVHNQRMSEF